ncbi:hypothetical protein EDD85DRAFT_972059 [Armillaria nabsnona]|nr:hypothetical protein EDD85DRAFT_972059 [Armillaria nabsnona]
MVVDVQWRSMSTERKAHTYVRFLSESAAKDTEGYTAIDSNVSISERFIKNYAFLIGSWNASGEVATQEWSLTIENTLTCNNGKLEADGLFTKIPSEVDLSGIHVKFDGWIRIKRRISLLDRICSAWRGTGSSLASTGTAERDRGSSEVQKRYRDDAGKNLTARIQVKISGGGMMMLEFHATQSERERIRGHRHKDRRRRSTRNLKLWIVDRHRYHQEAEIHGSNNEHADYLAIRRFGRMTFSVDYPVPTVPPSYRPQMLHKVKHGIILRLSWELKDAITSRTNRHTEPWRTEEAAMIGRCHACKVGLDSTYDSTDIETLHSIIKRILIDASKATPHGYVRRELVRIPGYGHLASRPYIGGLVKTRITGTTFLPKTLPPKVLTKWLNANVMHMIVVTLCRADCHTASLQHISKLQPKITGAESHGTDCILKFPYHHRQYKIRRFCEKLELEHNNKYKHAIRQNVIDPRLYT